MPVSLTVVGHSICSPLEQEQLVCVYSPAPCIHLVLPGSPKCEPSVGFFHFKLPSVILVISADSQAKHSTLNVTISTPVHVEGTLSRKHVWRFSRKRPAKKHGLYLYSQCLKLPCLASCRLRHCASSLVWTCMTAQPAHDAVFNKRALCRPRRTVNSRHCLYVEVLNRS